MRENCREGRERMLIKKIEGKWERMRKRERVKTYLALQTRA